MMCDLLTWKEARERLNVSDKVLREAIRDSGVSVYLKLPENAKLILNDDRTKSGIYRWPIQEIDLSGCDFASISSDHIVAAWREPDPQIRVDGRYHSIANYFTGFAKRDDRSKPLSDVDIKEIIKNSRDRLFSISVVPWLFQNGLKINRYLYPEEKLLLSDSGLLLESTLASVKKWVGYPADYNELDFFDPSDSTTEAIKVMHIAFQLFRIKKPLDDNRENRAHVKKWLENRWNTPERRKIIRGSGQPVGDKQLEKAALLILCRDNEVTLGNIIIPEPVREQHHPQAPDWLMLLEYLSQLQDQYYRKIQEDNLKLRRKKNLAKHQRKRINKYLRKVEPGVKRDKLNKIKEKLDRKMETYAVLRESKPKLDYELDFAVNGALKNRLEAQGVKPGDYCDLVVRLLTLDAKSQNATSRD